MKKYKDLIQALSTPVPVIEELALESVTSIICNQLISDSVYDM